MTEVRNISNGPRGAYLKGVLVMVDPGEVVEADDYDEAWFAPADGATDTSDIADLDLSALVKVAIAEGMLESEDEVANDLRRMIERHREHMAERDAGGQEPGPLDKNVEDLTEYLGTVEDVDTIQALIDAETAGKSRKGALAALEARRDELLAQ